MRFLTKYRDRKLTIQNSVITLIYDNLKHLVTLQTLINNLPSEDMGDELASDLEVLYGLAISSAELLFKDQYRRPYAAVRLNTEEWGQHLQIIPLESIKYKRYLVRIFQMSQEGKIVGTETINAVINNLARCYRI